MTDLMMEEVRVANTRFYLVLGQGDLAAMSAIWIHSDEAVCVHPGWPAIVGWENIRKSWETIFAHQGILHLWPSEVEIRLFGRAAQVRCVENIDATATVGGGVIQAKGLNRFLQIRGRWRLLEHRAQPMSTFKSPLQLDPHSPN